MKIAHLVDQHVGNQVLAGDDVNFLRHTVVTWEDDSPKLDWKPVTMTKWQPQERKY